MLTKMGINPVIYSPDLLNHCPTKTIRLSALSSKHIQSNSSDENRALDDVLLIILHAQQPHAVIKPRHEEPAEPRHRNRPPPPQKTPPTNDARRNPLHSRETPRVRRPARQ